MFEYAYTVRLRDTDAAGLLYFTEQLRMAHDAFEAYLETQGLTLAAYLARADFLLPIVHAEADYRAPLAVGDHLTIRLRLARAGTSSFTLAAALEMVGGTAIGSTQIVHCAIDRKTGRKIPLPDEVRAILAPLDRAP